MSKNLFEELLEAPATALDDAVQASARAIRTVSNQERLKKPGEFWKNLGPGLTTGAADDDPSGIATYSQAGAQYGFQLLWLSAFTFPLMAIVQEMCARIGLVTGRGLAANIRSHFPRNLLYLCTALLFVANSFNIGADLGAMAKGLQLLVPQLNFALVVIFFTVLSLALQIFTTYEKYARYLKYLALILFSYVLSALLAHLNWHEVLKAAVVPRISFNKEQIVLICAILGTTISPYLFFWQTSQEVEQQILEGKTTVEERRHVGDGEIKKMRIDVWAGMIVSNAVMFFIIAACGGVLYVNGITHIATASDAAEALRPIAGNATYLLFSLGILGTGMLAIPVLAGSTSYAISESLRLRSGLYRQLKEAHGFYGVMIISMFVGLGLNFVGLDPIKALIYSAVANGLVAPVVLVFIVLISGNRHIMGKHVNHPVTTFFGWLVTGLMVVSGLAALYSLVWP